MTHHNYPWDWKEFHAWKNALPKRQKFVAGGLTWMVTTGGMSESAFYNQKHYSGSAMNTGTNGGCGGSIIAGLLGGLT